MGVAPLTMSMVLSDVIAGESKMRDERSVEANQSADGSAENLKTLQRYVSALRVNDRSAAIAQYHDEITLHWYGHRLARTYSGKASALAVLAEFSKRSHRKFLDFVDVMAGPNRGVMITREEFHRTSEQSE